MHVTWLLLLPFVLSLRHVELCTVNPKRQRYADTCLCPCAHICVGPGFTVQNFANRPFNSDGSASAWWVGKHLQSYFTKSPSLAKLTKVLSNTNPHPTPPPHSRASQTATLPPIFIMTSSLSKVGSGQDFTAVCSEPHEIWG